MSSEQVVYRMRNIVGNYGISRSTVYRLIASGDFPSSFKLSARCVGWYKKSVDAYFGISGGGANDE